MKRLAILGASGHGKVVADIALACGWEQIEFFDDAWPERKVNGHWPVTGNTESLIANISSFDGVALGIGNNAIRREKFLVLDQAGAALVSLVHPQATLSRFCTLGRGCVVMANVVVNIDSRIGSGVILNTACSVDHDSMLGDFVHLSPGVRLAGGVSVGDLSWIGIGSNVRQLISIGSRVTVGAGAAVVKHVPDNDVVVGVPARSRVSRD